MSPTPFLHSLRSTAAALTMQVMVGAAVVTAMVPGGSLAIATPAAAATMANTVVYGLPHIEALLGQALAQYVPVGRLTLELDNRAMELAAPSDWGSPSVQNIYFNNISGRFAAELVIQSGVPTAQGTARAIRYPVAGRVYGVVQAPVLNQRIAVGDPIGPGDIDWIEVRADQLGSDMAASDAQLVGMTPRKGIPIGQPIRLRDVQTQRVVTKNQMVTISFQSRNMALSTQGRALEDGGVGENIRVVNTQSNRVVDVTVAGPNLVAVAKPATVTN